MCIILPGGVRRNESGIINLDNTEGPHTHWVAYAKRENRVICFDSFSSSTAEDAISRRKANRIQSRLNVTIKAIVDNCLQFLWMVDNQFKVD